MPIFPNRTNTGMPLANTARSQSADSGFRSYDDALKFLNLTPEKIPNLVALMSQNQALYWTIFECWRNPNALRWLRPLTLSIFNNAFGASVANDLQSRIVALLNAGITG